MFTKLLSLAVICLLWDLVRSTPLPLTPLQYMAERTRLQAGYTNSEYCNKVADHLPIFSQGLSSFEKCRQFADGFIGTTSLLSMPNSEVPEVVTEVTLMNTLSQLRQVNYTLNSLMKVVRHSLLQDGCPGLGECEWSCLADRQPEMDLLCSVNQYLLIDLRNYLLVFYDTLNITSDLAEEFAAVDITSHDPDSIIRYYNVIAFEYATRVTTVAKETIDVYDGQQ